MSAESARAIKSEIDKLVDLQIEALRRESSLSSKTLLDYHERSKQIHALYKQLDQIVRVEVAAKFAEVTRFPGEVRQSFASNIAKG